MNKNERYNVDNYLSIKRITFVSIAITIGFYVLFILKRYFSRPLLSVIAPVEYKVPYWIIITVNIVFSFIMFNFFSSQTLFVFGLFTCWRNLVKFVLCWLCWFRCGWFFEFIFQVFNFEFAYLVRFLV